MLPVRRAARKTFRQIFAVVARERTASLAERYQLNHFAQAVPRKLGLEQQPVIAEFLASRLRPPTLKLALAIGVPAGRPATQSK